MPLHRDFINVILNPKKLYSELEERDTRQTFLYAFLVSVAYYAFFLIRIYLRIRNNDIFPRIIHFEALFSKFNAWIIIYYIALLLMIYLGFLLIAFLISIFTKGVTSAFGVKLSFNILWKVIIYSLTPIVLWEFLRLIIYVMRVEILQNFIFLLYVYIFALIIFGINQNIPIKKSNLKHKKPSTSNKRR